MSKDPFDGTTEFVPLQGPHWQKATRVIGQSPKHELGFPELRLLLMPGAGVVSIRQTEAVLGRHTSADYQLMEAEISRRHCRLFYKDEQWFVEDLRSTNGTLLNGHPVTRAAIQPDDVLRVGSYLFQIDWECPMRRNRSGAQHTHDVLHGIAAHLGHGDHSPAPRPLKRTA